MLSKIGKAWRRQQVADAAGSVLRRYRQMRWSSGRRKLNSADANSTLGPVRRHVRPALNQTITFPQTFPPKKRSLNPSRSVSPYLKRTDASVHAPQRLWDSHAEGKSPSRGRESKRRHLPILVMDFSEPSSSHEFSELDKTFSISDSPPPSSSPSSSSPPRQERTVVLSPRSAYPEAGSSGTQPARPVSNREAPPNLPSHKRLTAVRPVVITAPLTPECSRTHCSPARENPFTRHHHASPNSHARSPLPAPASPHRSLQKPVSSLGRLYPRDSRRLTQSKLPTSQSPRPRPGPGQQQLQPRLSLDWSAPSLGQRLSSKQLDEEFKEVYRRFICRAESPLRHNPHCRFCERKVESEGRSSSILAALALSPYHLKKRHRELDQERSPQAKRPRDGCFVNSPGSLRQRKAMLRIQHRTSRFLSSTLTEPSSVSDAWSHKEPALGQARTALHPSTERQVKRAGEARFSLQLPALKEQYNRFVRQYQGQSPEPSEWSGCPSRLSSSLSRRRLLYK
ncbi:serine/arginine repetitive matrix protein 1 [Osmerus eperlanus]|uniref:serine/arginine repetitive matrix protein 1 n=1 Tax=Osmerus eperlanus TaxID=29151 RepID=UPI002E155DA7